MLKKWFFLSVFIVMSGACKAQFYKSFLPSPEFTNALEKIVLDFRFNYETIKGVRLSDEREVKTFESTVKLPGAEECVIHYFNSVVDTTASWQAVMYKGEDFKAASRNYENVFRLIKKSHVKWIDKSSVGFSGEMQPATEQVRFAASSLDFELEDVRYEKFKAEVELISSYAGWEVRLNLHTKRSDDQPLPGI